MASFGRSRRRMRTAALLIVVSAFLGAMVSAGTGVPKARAEGSPTWANHDNDNWGGWSDPANLGFATNPAGCDPLDSAQCLLPYPNDWFTRHDATSPTGRRLDLNVLAMPHNAEGKPIEPLEWNRSDGFSAGAQILTVVPGMTSNADLAPSGLPPDTNLAMNSSQNLGVILLDATTGKTWPVCDEVDQ